MNRRKKSKKSLYHISFTRYSMTNVTTFHSRFIKMYDIGEIDITKYCEDQIGMIDGDTVIINSISKLN